MPLKIGEYQADGPFTDLQPVSGRSGVYIMLSRSSEDEPWKVLDIRESVVLKHAIAYHLRAGSYDDHAMLAVAIIDVSHKRSIRPPNFKPRWEIERELRALYSLPPKKPLSF